MAMNDINVKLTVFFENPFWVGVFEHVENNFLIVSKVTFGAEPKGYEVLDYIIKNYYSLVFSPAVETKIKKDRTNPKKAQRDVRKQMQVSGIGTKSQLALKSQHEQNKKESKVEGEKKKRRMNLRDFY
ncbi:hypothetical protein HMPREF9099_03165 [Lachnospiraceae bacterium oral taxon 082 str. F0431]|nr:hypothetical protein HMPREF9099_03165 [Lachnospiraceae bacterium oral taxon 082 str. F0431]